MYTYARGSHVGAHLPPQTLCTSDTSQIRQQGGQRWGCWVWAPHPGSFPTKGRVREDNPARGCPHRQGVKRLHICMCPKPNFSGHRRCPSLVRVWTGGRGIPGTHSRENCQSPGSWEPQRPCAEQRDSPGGRSEFPSQTLGAEGGPEPQSCLRQAGSVCRDSCLLTWQPLPAAPPGKAPRPCPHCAPAAAPRSPAKNSPALTSGPRKLQPAPPQMATASFRGEAAGSARPAALWSVPEDTRLVGGRGMGSAGAPPRPPTPVPIQEAGQ